MFFSDNTRVRILFFLSRKGRNFSPEFNIRLYGKNSESDYFFFPLPKSEYFFRFSATLGIRIFFFRNLLENNNTKRLNKIEKVKNIMWACEGVNLFLFIMKVWTDLNTALFSSSFRLT